MKKLTIQLFTIAVAVIIFSATDILAQKRITLDSSGKATISATIKPFKPGNFVERWSISGGQFDKLTIRQTSGGKFKYEIRRGGEFLSSGHTTGSNITIQSDGKSTYILSITNEEDLPRPITLSISKQ